MSPPEKSPAPHVPVSWGELIDKITILQIKTARLESEAARANAARELAVLRALADPVLSGEVAALAASLQILNGRLWEIEDSIRAKEAAARFDDDFIQLARAVYKTNDERAALKRQINLALASELIEEKSYKPY